MRRRQCRGRKMLSENSGSSCTRITSRSPGRASAAREDRVRRIVMNHYYGL
jgi:hypothetical protein